jgi:hypothetical protein
VEIGVLVLLVLLERARPDLWVRRRWAALPLPRPALPLRVPAPIALAGVDARRLLLRASMLGVVFVLYMALRHAFPTAAYDGVNHLVGMYLAFAGLLVLALAASFAGRDRGVELLAALPCGPRTVVRGWAVLLLATSVVAYLLMLDQRYGRAEPEYTGYLPDPWELAQGPLLILGGGLLGVLLARVLPGWLAAVIGVVSTVMWTVLSSDNGAQMLAPVIEWIQYREHDSLVILQPGSFAWHNGFLLGLCGLGLVAAMLRESGRRAPLLATGAVLLGGTVAAAVLALP